jgi:hypothetical protein
MAKKIEKKKYQIDVSEFKELQSAIVDFFILMTEILNIEDLTVENISLNSESDKIIIEGNVETDEDSSEESEEDSDWEWL